MLRRKYTVIKHEPNRAVRIAWLYRQRKIDNAKTNKELNDIYNTPWCYFYDKVVAFLKKTS